MVQTVEENKSLFTKRQVEDAENARILIRRLGYPSVTDIRILIDKGGIINAPVTTYDVNFAQQILGPDIPTIKGKTKLVKTDPIKIEYIPRPQLQVQTLYVDLIYVMQDPYLLSYAKPIGLCKFLTLTDQKKHM
jgi:hypothetical protein